MLVIKQYKGFTLVEVVASIVILSLLIISFFPLFINGAKSTSISKDRINYSLIAQREIESIIHSASSSSISKTKNIMEIELKYQNNENNQYTKLIEDNKVRIIIIFKPYVDNDYPKLTNKLNYVQIQLYRVADSKLLASLETLIEWGG